MGADRGKEREAFGSAVRRMRLEAGLSQEGLALAAGLDRTYVSGVERGVRNPSLDIIVRLAGAMGKNPRDFFGAGQDDAESR